MDAKFYKRYENFQKSLNTLAEARHRDLNDSFVLSGTASKFSITFDLAWKVMKDIIIQYYAVVDFPKGSPREVLRKAFEFQLIQDVRPGDFVCRSCQGDDRYFRKILFQNGQLGIFGAEIMSPMRDTMRFIDGDQRNVDAGQEPV